MNSSALIVQVLDRKSATLTHCAGLSPHAHHCSAKHRTASKLAQCRAGGL